MESFDVEIDTGLFDGGFRSANEAGGDLDKYTPLASSASREEGSDEKDYSDQCDSDSSHGGSTDEEISVLYSMHPRRSQGLRQICEVPLNYSHDNHNNKNNKVKAVPRSHSNNVIFEYQFCEEHEVHIDNHNMKTHTEPMVDEDEDEDEDKDEDDTDSVKPKSFLRRKLAILVILIVVLVVVLIITLIVTRPASTAPNEISKSAENAQAQEESTNFGAPTAFDTPVSDTTDITPAPSFGVLLPPSSRPAASPDKEENEKTLAPTASPTVSPFVDPTSTGNSAWAYFLGVLSPYTTREILLDASKPQGRAFLQLMLDNVVSYETMSSTNVLQSYAVLTLYFSTSPKVWDSFLTTSISNSEYNVAVGKKSEVCSWQGMINCVESSYGDNVVSSITLTNAELDGVLPDELCLLEHLERLDLRSNALEGSIPSCLVASDSLKTLLLSDNSLSSYLPRGILLIPTLEELELDDNQLVGDLQNLIEGTFEKNIYRYGETWRLRRLNLDNNFFSGQIPAFFGALGSLKSLTLHGNDLTGEVDDMLCDRTRSGLVELTVDCGKVTCTCCSTCFY